MPELNLPFITLSEVDYSRIVQLFRQWTKRSSNPLNHIDPEKVTLALANSIAYLLSDRIKEGIGRGGWGYSDKEYMRKLYGSEVADQVHESVMTTVVVILALHNCLLQLEKTGIKVNGRSPRDLLDTLVDELDEYLRYRWDNQKGHGGVLVAGREGDLILTPRYRHTAWFFHVWHRLPKYRDRMKLTAINLLEEFDRVQWSDEKVATAVAAYSAFSLLENDPLCDALAAVPRVKHLKHVLEGQIESQFNHELSGWTSGNTLLGGRQLYTLFVCAEMAGMNSFPESVLSSQLLEALETTMGSKWCAFDGRGVPLSPNGQSDLSASALAASALMRQPRLTNSGQSFLSNIMRYLVENLAKDDDTIQGIFAWTLSYFLQDISQWLGEGKR